MDAAAKIFVVMLVISLIVGTIVYILNPEYRIKNIYESNKNYYPQITEELVKKNFSRLFEKDKVGNKTVTKE